MPASAARFLSSLAGLIPLARTFPTVETVGYFLMSLRDMDQPAVGVRKSWALVGQPGQGVYQARKIGNLRYARGCYSGMFIFRRSEG